MVTTYKSEYAVNLIPLELTALTDTNDTAETINSNVDKILSGNSTTGGSSTNAHATYLEHLTLITEEVIPTICSNTSTLPILLFVKIASAGSTGTPNAMISIDGTNFDILLTGINDFCLIPLNPTMTIANLKIKSSQANAVANVEIYLEGS